jgi:hypothetical protein
MSIDENDPRLQRIKGKLLSIGLAIPGTIRETYLQCGKKECACATKGGSPHGPYYFWNRKVNGKLTSKSISEEKLRLYQRWISNRQQIEELLQQLLEIGQEIAAAVPPENPAEKSKKRASAKRGK